MNEPIEISAVLCTFLFLSFFSSKVLLTDCENGPIPENLDTQTSDREGVEGG